jgi:hypothetical protein
VTRAASLGTARRPGRRVAAGPAQAIWDLAQALLLVVLAVVVVQLVLPLVLQWAAVPYR